MKRLLLCLLCCACASKQKATQQQKLSASSVIQKEHLVTEKVGFSRYEWQNDSSQLREQVLIYPEGDMEFGPRGFVGQAKAVLWLRQQNQHSEQVSNLNGEKESLQQAQLKEVVQVQQEQRLSEQKKFSFGSLRWVFLLLMLCVALFYWFWRKR